MSLRDRLVRIWRGQHCSNCSDYNKDIQLQEAELIQHIIQAFKDDGWVEIPQGAIGKLKGVEIVTINGKEVLTGQEWYERFEEELGKWISLTLQDTQEPLIVQSKSSVMESAKRASGIADKN